MSSESYSLAELRREYEETQKDYVAFVAAYDLIRKRLLESNESRPRDLPLHKWSGSSAVCGSLELAIASIERRRDAYLVLIKQVESGALGNTDLPAKPKLAIVRDP